MAGRTRLQDRYQLGEILGRGGMGVVYKARDTLMNRSVALKTILDVENRTALNLFYKEWGVQASIVHPNIAEIYDIGEFEDDGVVKPFFVMPLLPGVTLDALIRDGSATLTVERSLGIICQAARGLQAAHDHGLVHRDLKPSNLFVMQDDSVKIIDFGVAHLAVAGAKTSLKGTLTYMAPEQLEMKPPSPQTDIFSLAVVCYQTLTRRLPFQGNSEYEITEAILRHSPAPVSEINSSVNDAISSVVHKAMAKRPWHRFSSAKEFAESLQKGFHNQPLEFLDAEKIKPRVERAIKAFGEKDYEFASEILFELEAEGHLNPQITLTRRQLDQAVRKTTIRQLLESARRFMEAKEYGLALRKAQEALDLDAGDADVLALKNEIEKDQREKQFDEWFRLARQHVENQAFDQARQALESVLKLKPNDTAALRLSTELDRLEREVVQSREEKKRLYEAAMESWKRGEVTASLSKLEMLVSLERDRPDTDGDRGASYQKFYQQVRSEQDAVKNGYDEARTHLRNGDFAAARTVCDQYLAKYPSHSLFHALKVDLEERQRQKLSSFIAETDQRVDDEPDLDRRLGILEEALKAYPGEQHFERASGTVREKRDLVNSIVTKARFFEEKGQFNESLDQWQILTSIHSRYPGLELELERLTKRRDQQARTQAKARWGEQIDQHLERGDYDRAVDMCKGALAEFPNDAALLELEKLALKCKERSAEAMAVLSEGRELCDKGQFETGLAALRRAQQLDERNPVARKVLVNYLIGRARQLVDSDWKGADLLAKEVLDLEPGHSLAESLRNQVEDHKREEIVSQCVAEARRLQAEGNIDEAKAVVEKGLASYPTEPRLKQLQGTVTRAQSGATKMMGAARDLEELRRIEKMVAAGVDPSQGSQLVQQVKLIAQQHPEEKAIQQLAAQLGDRLAVVMEAGTTARPADAAAAAASPEAATAVFAKPGPERSQKKQKGKAAAQAPGAQPKPGARQTPAAGAGALKQLLPAGARQKQWLVAGAGAVVVLLLAAVALMRWTGRETAPPVAGAVPVTVRAYPAEAAIWVQDEQCGVGACDVELAPGTYQAQARLAGYQRTVMSFEVVANQAEQKPIALMLEPIAPVLYVTSDLESGEVLLDGAPAGKLEDGEFQLDAVPPGEHTLEITGSGSKASMTFEVRPGSMPIIHGPIATTNLKAAAVGSLGGVARVYSESADAIALLDGAAAGAVPADGLSLADLPEGLHEIKLGEGRGEVSLAFLNGAVPSLSLSLKSDRNVGGLRIATKEDGATVYINGQRYRRATQRGRLLVYLPPRQYTVRVEKPGFEAAPEQTVEIRRGEEAQLEFSLVALPETASVTIRNAPPGAEVLADGRRLGAIPVDGNSATFTFPPGQHTITLRKDLYKPKEWQREFGAGATVDLDGALANAAGILRIEVDPPNLNPLLTLRREGEADRPITDLTLTLGEGTYTATARANGYQEFAATVRVVADETKVARLTLRPVPSAESAGVVNLLATLAGAPGWTQEGRLLTRRGGNDVILAHDPAPGLYQFTILLQNGRRIEWYVNFTDDKNHVLFQIDGNNFNRVPVIKGQRQRAVRVRHGVDRDSILNIRVAVQADSITSYLYKDEEWVAIDTWREPGSNFLRGRFGFHVPSRDKIGLSSFTFTPR